MKVKGINGANGYETQTKKQLQRKEKTVVAQKQHIYLDKIRTELSKEL